MKHSVHLNFTPPFEGSTPRRSIPELVRFENVSKRYGDPATGELALQNVSLTLGPGGLIALVGKSGSGKSTLLNLLTGTDQPTAGQIHVAGTAVHSLNETTGALWRRASVGIVFQFFQLLPALTVLENVLLPMALLGRLPARQREIRARDLLAQVGIADHAHKLPTSLSGGQQQRCAIARALANQPPLLVADEPTGNLDSRTADAVLALLRRQADLGTTVVVVTHERDIARVADRIITLADGRVQTDELGAARSSLSESRP
jgi:putative ABC transport system ATP-binding protein